MFNSATLSRVLSEMELDRISESLQDLSFSNVLVVGSGKRLKGSESILLRPLNKSTRIIFADQNRFAAPDILMDPGISFSVKSDIFNMVISTWLAEHLMHPELLFFEAFRVLRGGGIFICSVPFIYRKHEAPYDYFRFTDTALSNFGVSAGFKEVQIRQVGGAPFACCVSLIWPIIRLPFLGMIMYLLARILDGVLRVIAEKKGKASGLFTSYPINYIIVAIK